MPEEAATTDASTAPIVVEQLIDASPETVFPFFTEPEKMTRWLCDAATSNPQPGGVLEQTHTPRDDAGVRLDRQYHARGKYVELDPPNRLVFTWGWDETDLGVPPGSSTVEVTLTPQDGGTLVRLAHSDLPESSTAQHKDGWTQLLGRLAEAVA